MRTETYILCYFLRRPSIDNRPNELSDNGSPTRESAIRILPSPNNVWYEQLPVRYVVVSSALVPVIIVSFGFKLFAYISTVNFVFAIPHII